MALLDIYRQGGSQPAGAWMGGQQPGMVNAMPIDRSYLTGGGPTPMAGQSASDMWGSGGNLRGMETSPLGGGLSSPTGFTGLQPDYSGVTSGTAAQPNSFSPQPILKNGQTVGYMPTTSDYTNSLSPTDQQSRLQTLRQSNPGASDQALQYFDTGDYYGQKGNYQNILNRPPTQWELAAKARSDAENSQRGFWNDAGKPLALSALAAVGTGGLSIGGQAAQATQAGPAPDVPVGRPNSIGGGGLGDILAGGAGIAGSIDQQRGTQNYADWARNQGQSYRDLLNQSYSNPSAYLSSPEVSGAVQQGTNALARSLSVQGNPTGSGGALQQIQNYATNDQLNRLAQYRQQLGGFGGLSAINQSIPGAAGAAIGARGDTYNAGGSLLRDIFNRGGGILGGYGGIFNRNPGSLPTDPNIDPNTGLPTNYPSNNTNFDPNTGFADMGSTFDPSIDWGSLYG